MDKIVHELAGFHTDVYFQAHHHMPEDMGEYTRMDVSLRYHCAHCKKKGVHKEAFRREKLHVVRFNVMLSPGHEEVDLREYLPNCPNCNATWEHTQTGSLDRSMQKVTFDNGDVMYLHQYVHPRWKDAQPIVGQIKLRVCATSGKMRLTFNERSVYEVHTVRRALGEFRKYFPEVATDKDYFISRNKRLEDFLAYTETLEYFFSNIVGNHRRRMYYAYDKHGMKGAYRAILGGKGNKYLYKLAWSQLGLLHILNDLLTHAQADQISTILNHVEESRINYDLLDKIKSLFSLGYSTVKVRNIAKNGDLVPLSHWVCQDSNRMYQTLLERTGGAYQVPKHKDVNELHDLLLRDINQVEDERAKLINLPVTDLEEYHNGPYSVKIAKTAHDLNLLGRRLNICVAGYRNIVLRGDRVIAYVTQGNHMVACLEIDTGYASLVQAKLARNNYVRADAEVERIVYSWLKQNQLSANTHDVDFKINKDVQRKIILKFQEETPSLGKRPPNAYAIELAEDLPF